MSSKPEITDLIPHRPPFLWVDSILEYDSVAISTTKKIDEDLDLFKGHYPSHPILPGVILCEALFQSGALLIALILRNSETEPDGVPVITRIEDAKFKRPVGPGDTIHMQVQIREKLAGVWFLKGILRVNKKVAVKLTFACTLAQISDDKQ